MNKSEAKFNEGLHFLTTIIAGVAEETSFSIKVFNNDLQIKTQLQDAKTMLIALLSGLERIEQNEKINNQIEPKTANELNLDMIKILRLLNQIYKEISEINT